MTSLQESDLNLKNGDRAALLKRLHNRQNGRCFICDDLIDLTLQQDQLDIDHIVPKSEGGADDENNFAVTHSGCNRSKSASDLRVARRLAEFERLQQAARDRGERGANLGHLLNRHDGAMHPLRMRRNGSSIEFSLAATGNNSVLSMPLYRDKLSDMEYFFTVLPIEYLHHDDRINPRNIGANIRGLIEEFMKKRPQLHVALAWWAPEENGAGKVKVFDGQHKAAAQILLGTHELPVRVFVEPDTNVLLAANTNAGEKLRQVAFDKAVMRHLGNSLYVERVRQYREMKGLHEDDYSFSEQDLAKFFKGEHRELKRYIVDAARDSVTRHSENQLMEFVEWSGKGTEKPLSYSTIDRTFFSEFLYQAPLDTPLDYGMESGENPRTLERDQLVKMMTLFAEIFFINKWDPEFGGYRIENRVQSGDPIPEDQLRAWRIARYEIMVNVLRWVRLVIENYYAFTGSMIQKDRLLHRRLSDQLWSRIETFLKNLAELPCWVDRNLSNTVFGAKQNNDFWRVIFDTGKAPNGVQVLAKPLDLNQMIQ